MSKRKKRWEKRKKKRKRPSRYTEFLITISSKKSQRDKSNDTKKYHRRWFEWVTLTAQRWEVTLLSLAGNVTHSNHHWWTFLVSMNLSYQNLFEGSDDIVIWALMCLHNLFLYFFFISPAYLTPTSYKHHIFF
jgi:hypothetical protein